MKPSKEEILAELKKIMYELFEIDPNTIRLDSNLYDELDIDSIDAVDLIAHLQTLTGKKFSPEEFKSVRTVEDVINVLHQELMK